MLTLFYKSEQDADCDCAVIKYVDRIWLDPKEEKADVLRFFVIQNSETSKPLHRIRMLIPCGIIGAPEDLCRTCDDPEYFWNIAAGGDYMIPKHLSKESSSTRSGEISEDGIENIRFFARCDQEVRKESDFSIIDIMFPAPIEPGERVELRSRFQVDKVVLNKFPQYELSPLYRFDLSYLGFDEFAKYQLATAAFIDATILRQREIPIWTLFNDDPTHPGGFDLWVNLPSNHVMTEKSEFAATKTSDRNIEGKLIAPPGEKIVWRARLFKGGRKLIRLGDGLKLYGEFGPVLNIQARLESIETEFQSKVSVVATGQLEVSAEIASLRDEQKKQNEHLQILTGNLTALIGDVGRAHAVIERLVSVQRITLTIAVIAVILAALGILFSIPR